MDDAEHDVLAFMTFPRAHWAQIYSTNPLERLNAEIKRRTNVVGIFPNDASITRLVGAMMLEQNDEWSLNRRYVCVRRSHPNALHVARGGLQAGGDQRCGSSSSIRLAGCVGSRSRTSLRYA